MHSDLEGKVKECHPCQVNRKAPPNAPLHPWIWPNRPWSRLHIDHAGPFMGKLFLVVVDAHSKWLEVKIVPSTSSQATIHALRSIFAIHGLPDIIVSDNGTAFTSSEFNDFMQKNGIRHIKSPPYHPASNGLAERAVQTFKDGLKKSSKGDLETHLTRFLFQYRITPHSTTGITPAELLMGRRPKARLDLLKPNVDARVEDIQVKQKFKHDQHAKDRCFHVGENVFIRIHGTGGTTWRSGKIISQRGQTMYKVKLPDGKATCRHIDDIRIRTDLADQRDPEGDAHNQEEETDTFVPDYSDEAAQDVDNNGLRRSKRLRRPPNRFMCGDSLN